MILLRDFVTRLAVVLTIAGLAVALAWWSPVALAALAVGVLLLATLPVGNPRRRR